jgi:hypothetical protein
LRFAKFPQDESALAKKAQDLSSSVWDLRRKLHDYSSILPPDFQNSASDVETALSKGLADKSDSLQHIALQLTGEENLSREKLVELGTNTEKIIEQAMAKVSELIEKLSAPEDQQKSATNPDKKQ